MDLDIQILNTTLSIDDCYDWVSDDACGAIGLFIGTVRNHNKGEQVRYLDFESYNAMALKEMRTIAEECKEIYKVSRISMHHREGKVMITGKAVIIAVSSVHRKEAFKACEYLIDQLKERVPIWKKEYLIDGSYWVNSRP